VTRKGWILFGLMGVIWGLPYLMIKVAVGGVSVPVLVFARTVIGAVLLLPFALRRMDWQVLRRHWVPIVAFAVFEVIGPWALLADAERGLSSSTTGLLIASVPIIAAVLVSFSGERLGIKQWAGLAVGFGGVAVLAGPNLSGGDAWSIIEVVLVAVGYAIAAMIAGRRLEGVPGLVLATVCLGFAAVVYLPFAVLHWPEGMPAAEVLWALGGLGVVCTGLAFLLFFGLIREVGPARALVITYVNPVVAVGAGVVVLGEPLGIWTVVSFVLILCGSLLATSRVREPVAVVK
jgi:drug/metabolite transporter (DMT)-like permease